MWFQKRLGQSIKMQRAKTPWPQTLCPSLSFSLLFAGRKSILSCRSHHKYGRSNGGSVYGQVLFACVYVLPLLMTICWGLHKISTNFIWHTFRPSSLFTSFSFFFFFEPGINLNNFRFWRQWSAVFEVCMCLWFMTGSAGILRVEWLRIGQLSGQLGLDHGIFIQSNHHQYILAFGSAMHIPFATFWMSYSCACGYAMINLWSSMGVLNVNARCSAIFTCHQYTINIFVFARIWNKAKK